MPGEHQMLFYHQTLLLTGACLTKLGATLLHAIDSELRLSFHAYNPLVWMNRNAKEHKLFNYRDIFVHPKVKQ